MQIEIETFLQISSTEEKNKFIEMFSKATPNIVESVIKSVEDYYHIYMPEKEKKLAIYNQYYGIIANILNSYGLKIQKLERRIIC